MAKTENIKKAKTPETAAKTPAITQTNHPSVSAQKIAVVRVRGPTRVNKKINDTLRMLHIERNNACTVVPKTPSFEGMLIKVKDYVAYGEIDEQTYKLLIEKKSEPFMGRLTDSKGRINYSKFIVYEDKKLKPYFRLNPPKGGFERKGIKTPFKQGGAIGYRGKLINELISRMI